MHKAGPTLIVRFMNSERHKKMSNFFRKNAKPALLILSFAFIATVALIYAQAKDGDVVLEAEVATTTGNALKVDDPNASGSKSIRFKAQGSGGGSGSYVWPLKISSNNRYLVDQNGRPFFYAADTSWTMLGYLSVDDAKKLIDIRKSQGFSAIQTILVPWGAGRSSSARGAAFTNNDLTKPNEAYFSAVDQIMDYAETKGMVLYIPPLWMANNGGWAYSEYGEGDPTPSQAAFTSFMTWVGNRYKNQGNIIWVMGGDDEIGTSTSLKIAGANALRAADPNHLMTYHPRWAEYGLKDQPWFDFYAFQKNDITAPYPYQQVREALGISPTKPVLDAEPPYEPSTAMQSGNVTTALMNRRFGWWAALSGAMGVVYGGPQGSWAVGYKSSPNWSSDIERTQAKHTGNINKILSPLGWQKLSPDWDSATVISGRGSYGGTDYVTAGRADDGSLIVAYVPSARSVSLDMSKMSGAATVQWFDPASGESAGTSQTVANSGSQSFATPGNNSEGDSDWVLVVRKN